MAFFLLVGMLWLLGATFAGTEFLRRDADSLDREACVAVLFVTFCVFIPTIGMYFIAGGLVPIWMHPVMMLGGGLFGLLLGSIHIAFHAALFYGLSWLTNALIFAAIPSARVRRIVLIGLMCFIAAASLAPIYFPFSHSSGSWTNLIGVLSRGY